MNEYVELARLKSAMTITDVDRDDLLDLAREAASRIIDAHCGRRFYLDAAATAKTYRMTGRVCGTDDGDLFFIDDIGDTAGLVIEVGNDTDGWTAVTTEVEHEPDNALARGRAIEGLLRPYWTQAARGTRVRVTALWGWPAVPPAVQEAALILAARLYKRKDSPEGVLGSSEWGTVRLSRTDPDVASALADFVLPGLA